MSHRLLSAAAALKSLGASASTTAIAAGTAAPPTPAPTGEDAAVDVVSVADAQNAVAQAEQRGTDAERARTSAVFASDAGKANPTMGAWLLEHNPAASSDAIVAKLGTMPAPAAAVVAEPAPAPAAPAPAAITTPLEQTPAVVITPAAHSGSPDGSTKADIDASWDTSIAKASATAGGRMGADLAPGVPRTGN